MSRNNLILLAAGTLIGLGIGCLLFFGLSSSEFIISRITGNRAQGVSPAVPAVNSPAPDFELALLSGEQLRLSDLRGHTVVINYWATWCYPCRLEMPLLQKYSDQYGSGLKVLAVNYDESQADVQAFVDDLGLSFDVLLDPGGEVSKLYRVRAFPSTFFVDAEGVIRYLHIGELNERQLLGYLEQVGVGQ